MSLRFRKSLKIAPGIKLNFSKKSASVTVGGNLYRETVSTSGKTTQSVSIPGTGIYATKTVSKSKKSMPGNTPTEYKPLREISDEKALDEAKIWLKNQSTCKESILATDLNIPFTQASKIIDLLEKDGVVGAFRGAQGREIL